MRRVDVIARRGLAALGTAVLPAVLLAQQSAAVGGPGSARGAFCGPGGMMARPAMRAGGAAVGGDGGDSLLVRRTELERLAVTRMRAPAAGERIRIDRTRGWMGLRLSELSETRVGADGWSVRYCDYPVVVSVEPASPAQRAGIEPGDTIVAYNGVDLRSGAEIALDRLLVPDDTLRVGLRRGGHARTVSVIVGRREATVATRTLTVSGASRGFEFVVVSPPPRPGARGLTLAPGEAPTAPTVPAAPAAPAPTRPPAPFAPMALAFGLGPSAIAGAQIIALDEELGAAVGTRTGVLVLRVAERTPADEAGLRPGDVIVLAGGRSVASPLALQQALVRGVDERAVPLRVVRKGKARELTLRW